MSDPAKSVCSRRSGTVASSASSRNRAKAAASQARAEFALKEFELSKHLSLLESEETARAAKATKLRADVAEAQRLLEIQKEAAVDRAEVEAEEDGPPTFDNTSEERRARVQQYVADLPELGLDPHSIHSTEQRQLGNSQDEFAKFLLKKELNLTRLTHFSERPETFNVWSISFKAVVRELDVSPSEELDLLVRYLGSESSKTAQSIRASNPKDPAKGLKLLWERLEERYGSPELVEACLRERLNSFPQISNKNVSKLYDLCDLLEEMKCAKEDEKLAPLFAVYDSSVGANTIIDKLPYGLKQKWIQRASNYKEDHGVVFPPFAFLVKFVRNMSKIQNDPAFQFDNSKRDNETDKRQTTKILARKSEIQESSPLANGTSSTGLCPIHKARHALSSCHTFKTKTWDERRTFLRDNGICFKCLSSKDHRADKCSVDVRCEKCDKNHCTVMHRDFERTYPPTNHGGERRESAVTSRCTTLCGPNFTGRSCGKIVLVNVFPEGEPENGIQTYAVIDDQSNRSLATPELMDKLSAASEEIPYKVSTCSGTRSMSGRQAFNVRVRSFDKQTTLQIPSLIECDSIPDDRSEIPTPDVAHHHSHLRQMANNLPILAACPIGLLIGRDLPEAHHVLEQVTGPAMSPFAQRLPLGWVIVGDVCLEKRHKPSVVRVNKTSVDHGARGTIFESCPNSLKCETLEPIGANVFEKTQDDEKPGLSIEDRKFVTIMNNHFKKNEDGRWSAPLPFKSDDSLPIHNRTQALGRALVLERSLGNDPVKKEHFFKFMKKVLDSGAAEKAPPLDDEADRWYLPLFGVYHPKKPDKIRGVFDSSATFKGFSLNSVMFSGPDLTNSLVGILLRLRRDACALSADIEQMFYQFFVHEKHRDYLRFFWYEDNDFNKPLTEFRMCVHVFGNSPSPAVATYGLRKIVASSEDDVKQFVTDDFYVDDGVTSQPQTEQAVSLMKRTQDVLMTHGNVRLHKLASNDRGVLKALPTTDLCEELQSIDLSDPTVPLPVHSCLGLPWDLNADTFSMKPTLNNAPFTRRGTLSVLNGIFDPLGFLAPVVIAGKILLRKFSPNGKDWDESLPETFRQEWLQWKQSVECLQKMEVPRMFVPFSLSQTTNIEFHVFSDASEEAIAAAIYVEVREVQRPCFGFVMGKAKVAPASGHTIPRLELCAALMATELWQLVSGQLDVAHKRVSFYTDSMVVLGYVSNETRRFHTYVSNRVERIRRVTNPKQWNYIPTDKNPADAATRGFDSDLSSKQKTWLQGPKDMPRNTSESESTLSFSLVSPDEDKEIRPCVRKTEIDVASPSVSSRFEKFSSWEALVRSFSLLRHICQSFQVSSLACGGWHHCDKHRSADNFKDTEIFIIKAVQKEAFSEELKCLRKRSSLHKSSSIYALSPYLCSNGLLRVGGRLHEAKDVIGLQSIHPVILPKKHHVSTLLVQYFHKAVKHQGRHFTEGALRTAGYWIIGAKRLVASTIQQCFKCKRLRGTPVQQQMANLPSDKVVPSAPFSHVGTDVFGPWLVMARKTRGGVAHSKRWAVIFTCMATRAVHIEVIEEMSSSSFINALSRFVALRGPVSELRSDRGTNFVGAAKELRAEALFVEGGHVLDHLSRSGIRWKFNPPHASHMGGTWERMIGVIRKILDSMLLDMRRKPLTHEVLCTMMAEVSAIVNNRPIVQISHDPDSPLLLTPSMLLTAKTESAQSPCSSTDLKEIYKHQWKHVQVLSNIFWKHWKDEYLQSLQQRRMWQNVKPNVKEGDLVLVVDKTAARNMWPVGLVIRAFPGERDGLVRSVEVRIVRDGNAVTYIRPVSEVVIL